VVADKVESQDICFVPDGDHTTVIRRVRGADDRSTHDGRRAHGAGRAAEQPDRRLRRRQAESVDHFRELRDDLDRLGPLELVPCWLGCSCMPGACI